MKTILHFFPALLLASALLLGCATTQSIDQSKRTRTFNADYLTTFRAALDYFNAKGFAVVSADKDLGIINTDFKENDGTSKFFVGNARAKVNLTIREQKSTEKPQTRVIAIISAEEMQGNLFQSRWVQSTMSEGEASNYYQKIFDGIQRSIDGKNDGEK